MAANDEVKRKRLARWVGVGLVAATIIVVTPLIYTLIKGLAGLVVAGVIGAAIISFAPVVAMKFANWKLKAIKSEARANPIETLQNNLLEDRRKLEVAGQGLKMFRAKVSALAQRVEASKQRVKAEALKPTLDALEKMRLLLTQREAQYRKAVEAVQQKAINIAQAQELWEISLVAQDAMAASGMSEHDALASIQMDEAYKAVDESVHLALADLDDELYEMGAQAQLENNPSDVIDMDVNDVRVGSPIPVRSRS